MTAPADGAHTAGLCKGEWDAGSHFGLDTGLPVYDLFYDHGRAADLSVGTVGGGARGTGTCGLI